MQTILVATWRDRLYQLTGGGLEHEWPDRPVQWLARAGEQGVLAIVGSRSLCRRSADGSWSTLAASEHDLACCVAVDGTVYVGTADAQLLRLQARDLVPLPAFMQVPGRERWYAGSALVDGRIVGPPLGIRSMAATCDGHALLANVHVGGIARSTDGGSTWQPTIDVDTDVHQVCAHPKRPELVAAAAAAGLCVSHDGGKTWRIELDGLHAHYCSAVAFAGDDVLVAASTDHFTDEGALYRRALDRPGLTPLCGTGGLPRWFNGIVDTGNIAVRGTTIAVADRGGHVYASADGGRSWRCMAEGPPLPSSVFICP